VHPQKRTLVWIIAVGGVAVLASYAYTLLGYPELSGGLWGDLPSSLLPFYQVCMLLAATGYFFYTYFLLFRLHPPAVRIAGRFGYSLFYILYLLILIPSALWTPLTLVMLRVPSPWLWAIIRLTLAAVALGSLGLLAALLIDERMSGRQVVGAAFSLAGVMTLISGGRFRFWQGLERGIGDLIVLSAVALWALYSVLGRRAMERRSALSTSAFSALLGLPVLLLAAAWEIHRSDFVFQARLILPLLYIGVAPGVIGFLSWNAGVRRLGASGAMVFYNTLPLYGALLGHFLLGEPLGLTHLVGGTLIVGGGLWAAARNQGAQRREATVAEIRVEKTEQKDAYQLEVTVQERGSTTRHSVTLKKGDYERLTAGEVTPEELVAESFRFLLEREPKESILHSFDLTVISRYFPEYEEKIAERL